MLAHVLLRGGFAGASAGTLVDQLTPSTSNNLDAVIVGGIVSIVVAALGYLGLRRSRKTEDSDELVMRDRVTTVEANLKSLRSEVRGDIKEVKAAVDRIEEHFWKDPA